MLAVEDEEDEDDDDELDFAELFSSVSSTMKEIVAFANTNDGTIYIGIDDNGKAHFDGVLFTLNYQLISLTCYIFLMLYILHLLS